MAADVEAIFFYRNQFKNISVNRDLNIEQYLYAAAFKPQFIFELLT
jgi:hypothetical protein